MAQYFVSPALVSTTATGGRIRETEAYSHADVRQPTMFVSPLSWASVFAGAVIAISLQVVLTLLGATIGLFALSATEAGAGATAGDTATTAGIIAYVWWLVTGLVSLFAGGLVAGRLCGSSISSDGVLHGALVWGLTLIVSMAAITSGATALIGGALNLTTQAATSPVAAQTMQTQPDPIDRAAAALEDMTRTGGTATQPAPRQQAQTEETAREVASGAGQAALWSFVTLTLGLICASIGGSMGRAFFTRFETVEQRVGRPAIAAQPKPVPDAATTRVDDNNAAKDH